MAIWLADILVIIHFIFICFVVLGGLLLFWSKKIVVFHVPAIIWGVLIEYTGWICPLTPLENWFRYLAGSEIYEGGFIENYLLPIIYPPELTRGIQIILGSLLLVFNISIYWHVFLRGFWLTGRR